MKKLTFVLILVSLLFASTLSAQTTGFMEGWTAIAKSKSPSTTMDFATTTPLKSGWAIEAWGLKCDGWGEGYIGVSKSLAPWITVIGQVGIEQADSLWRVAGSAWLGKGPVSTFFVYEDGGSGYWYKSVSKYQVAKAFAIGVLSQRFIGTGPYLELGVGKMKIWTAPVAFGTGQVQGVAGLKFGF